MRRTGEKRGGGMEGHGKTSWEGNVVLILLFLLCAAMVYADEQECDAPMRVKEYEPATFPNGANGFLYLWMRTELPQTSTNISVLLQDPSKELEEWKMLFELVSPNTHQLRRIAIEKSFHGTEVRQVVKARGLNSEDLPADHKVDQIKLTSNQPVTWIVCTGADIIDLPDDFFMFKAYADYQKDNLTWKIITGVMVVVAVIGVCVAIYYRRKTVVAGNGHQGTMDKGRENQIHEPTSNTPTSDHNQLASRTRHDSDNSLYGVFTHEA